MRELVYLSVPPGRVQAGVSDLILEICLRAGFEVVRRDQAAQSYKVTQDVLDHLRRAAFVIADITNNPPVVLYEVGIAQTLGKPVLLLAERGSPTPFDLAATQVVTYAEDEGLRDVKRRLEASIEEIHRQLQAGTAPTVEATVSDARRKQVFISYSHKDKAYLDRLLVHLQPLEIDGRCDLWVDTRLRAGDKWRTEIEAALSTSSVVVLLASADYLASEFIRSNELPQMLSAAEQHGTRILPLVLRPCRFARHQSLKQFQSLNDPSRPIALLPEDEREVFFDLLAGEVERYM